MKMLVLGGGLQGSACAWSLLQNPAVSKVTLADAQPDRDVPFLQPYRGQRLHLAPLDARD